MITTKDKIKLKKPMGVFTNVGEICDVVGISDEGVISFKFGSGHVGCMSYDELDKYFEVIPSRTWSEWKEKCRWITGPDGEPWGIEFSYRYNGKRVQVRCGNIQEESGCSPCDNFDLEKGIEIAFLRLTKKLYPEYIDEMIKREY